MEEPLLKARLREIKGKGNARRLRRQGDVPCILYGVEKESLKLSVNRKELEKLLGEAHSVIELNYDNTKQRAVVKEIQYHPIKGEIIHLDLQRIKAGQEVTIAVPLKFVGNSPGVKMGGVFQEQKSELEITCLPKHLPHVIEVDISELNIGDAIHVSDLALENISIKSDVTTTICSVAVPRKIEEVVTAEPEEEEFEEEAEPEVISGKAKKEEGEEEQAQKEEQG
jgi:large subunit ribosomal protein L25